MTDIYLVSARRTAIGTFGGTLKDFRPPELGTIAARAAIADAGVDPAAVGTVVIGQVIPTEPRDAYLARLIGIGAGLVLLISPASGAVSLTLVLIAFFIVEGVVTIMYAIEHRAQLTAKASIAAAVGTRRQLMYMWQVHDIKAHG